MAFLENFFFSWAGIVYLFAWAAVCLSLIKKNALIDRYAQILVYVFSFLFLGLRDFSSGTDTREYVEGFHSIKHFTHFRQSWDLLYNYFAYFVSIFTDGAGFILINVLVQLFLISVLIKKLGIETKALALLAYITFLPGFDLLTNGLRQGFSTPLALLIILILQNRKGIYKSFVLILLAFHKSILVFLPVFFVMNVVSERAKKITINVLLICIPSLILLWHFVKLKSNFSTYILFLTFDLSDSQLNMGQKLNAYLVNQSDMLSGIYRYYFLAITCLFLFCIFYFKDRIKDLPNYKQILDFSFLVICLMIPYAVVWISPFSYRFLYIFYLPALLLCVFYLNILKSSKMEFIVMFGILISAILTYGSGTFSEFGY